MFMMINPMPADGSAMPAPAVRTAKCGCCGMRRDLVAFTSMAASRPDLCRACGHDRVCGRECTSKPRTYAVTFNPSDWDTPA